MVLAAHRQCARQDRDRRGHLPDLIGTTLGRDLHVDVAIGQAAHGFGHRPHGPRNDSDGQADDAHGDRNGDTDQDQHDQPAGLIIRGRFSGPFQGTRAIELHVPVERFVDLRAQFRRAVDRRGRLPHLPRLQQRKGAMRGL